MSESLKAKRFDLLNEDDFVIIKDKQMLLHNIKNVELKEKGKEIERLNNIIKEAKEYIGHNYFVVGRIEKIYKILDKADKGE